MKQMTIQLMCQLCGYKGFPEGTDRCPLCGGTMMPQEELGAENELDTDDEPAAPVSLDDA